MVKKSDFGDDAKEKNQRHRGQYQAKAKIVFFLLRRHVGVLHALKLRPRCG
jgi:hypothetical protein